MMCRSFLTPDRSGNGWNNISRALNYNKRPYCGGDYNIEDGHNTGSKYWGRFNCGVVTLNLPDIALSSKGDYDLFWKIFDERLELCHKGLQWRINNLKGVKAEINPLLWCYGALARLNPEDEITPLLYDGYATVSLGYIGLYETVKYMTGESHTKKEGKKFGLEVMQYLNNACSKWKEAENIDYSLYGTPAENLIYKASTALQKRFSQEELAKAMAVE